MTSTGATRSSQDTNLMSVDTDVAVREALLNQLTRYVDAVCRSIQAAEAAGVDPVAPVGSAWSLPGLVKHLAYVHRYWFQQILAANATDDDFPWSEEDPDADWRVEAGETTEHLISLLRAECAGAVEVARTRGLQQAGMGAGAGPTTTLHVLVHMVQELARHAGQLDIVLELRGVRATGR